jgi:hypothetical protein
MFHAKISSGGGDANRNTNKTNPELIGVSTNVSGGRWKGLVQITGDWPGVPGTGAFLQCGTLRSLHDQR